MKKRLLSLVLAVLLIVSILPISAMAAEGSVTYKKVEVETAPETTDVLVEPEEPNYVSLVIMIVVVAGVIVGAFFLMKSNKKEEQKAKNQNKAKNRKQK